MSTHQPDVDLRALYEALDEQRRARDLTWAGVTAGVNRHRTQLRPIAQSTITSLKEKRSVEGDGILQMLLWLGRTPESFVPGVPDATRRVSAARAGAGRNPSLEYAAHPRCTECTTTAR